MLLHEIPIDAERKKGHWTFSTFTSAMSRRLMVVFAKVASYTTSLFRHQKTAVQLAIFGKNRTDNNVYWELYVLLFTLYRLTQFMSIERL